MVVRSLSPETHELFRDKLENSPDSRRLKVDGKEFKPVKVVGGRNPQWPEYGEYALGREENRDEIFDE